MPSKLLEVCVDNYDSAITAIECGANRLELCSSLIDGGLTPTPGLLDQILTYTKKVPIFCLLRCRPGNFIYNQNEIEIMKKDAIILKKSGADGFVFGALNNNGEVNMKQCREIILACSPLPVTFHRAFDFCKRPTIEIEVLIDLGFKRVLTSGKQATAQLGSKLIKKLIDQVGDRIILMPGGGINKQNIGSIIENCDPKELHGSFRKDKKDNNESVGDHNDDNDKEFNEIMGTDRQSLYEIDKEHLSEVLYFLKNI